MTRRFTLRTRGAVAVLVAALTGGTLAGSAAAAEHKVPDLSSVSLAELHTHKNPALAAAVSRVLEASDTATPLYFGFQN